MYEDGIISHIEVLHTSVQPSVNCAMPEPRLGHTAGENSVSIAHTYLLISVKDSCRRVTDSKVHTLKKLLN